MSEKENKKKSKPIEYDGFDDFESAFFAEGENLSQGSIPGEYVEEEFGSLIDDFEILLTKEANQDLDLRPPKKQEPSSSAVSASHNVEENFHDEEDFALDGFAMEEELALSDVSSLGLTTPADTYREEIDLSIGIVMAEVSDDSEDFDVFEDFDVGEFEEGSASIQIPIEATEPKIDLSTSVAREHLDPKNSDDFALDGDFSFDESFQFDDLDTSTNSLLDSPLPSFEEQIEDASIQKDDDFAFDEDLALDDFALDDSVSNNQNDYTDITDNTDIFNSESTEHGVSNSPSEEVSGEQSEEPLSETIYTPIELLVHEAKASEIYDFLYEAGLRQFVDGNFEDVLNLLHRTSLNQVTITPHNRILFESALHCGDTKLVVEYGQKLLQNISGEEASAIHETLADYFSKQDDKHQAQKYWSEAIAHNSQNAYAYLRLFHNSKELLLWNECADSAFALGNMATGDVSDEFYLLAAEICWEYLDDKERTASILALVKDSSHRKFKRLSLQMGAVLEGASLTAVYTALKAMAENRNVDFAHPLLRWVQILQAEPSLRKELIIQNLSFATGVEAKISQIILARLEAEPSSFHGLFLESPEATLVIPSQVQTFEQALELCSVDKNLGLATKSAILMDMYLSIEGKKGPASRKLGRNWLGIRRGAMNVHPAEHPDLFQFEHAEVIQELWYIHLSMKPELESLYIQRAAKSTDTAWKAHWFFQAGLVQNKAQLFQQAREITGQIPLGFTQEYIAAWRDWQFGEGDFDSCVQLLEKQAKICPLPEYKLASKLLSGWSESRDGSNNLIHAIEDIRNSRLQSVESIEKICSELSEEEQSWVLLSVLLANPSIAVLDVVLQKLPKLPAALVLALTLQSQSITSSNCIPFLDKHLDNESDANELRVAALFVQKDETKLERKLVDLDLASIQEEVSILAEIEGMWTIAQYYSGSPEEILCRLYPQREAPKLAKKLQEKASASVAMSLFYTDCDNVHASSFFVSHTSGNIQRGFHYLSAKNKQNLHEDSLDNHWGSIPDNPFYGQRLFDLLFLLRHQNDIEGLSNLARRCSSKAMEISLILSSMEAWEQSKQILNTLSDNPICDYRLESISYGTAQWEELYELLKKRMTHWVSVPSQNDAKKHCASVMLEHLADKQYTLLYYQQLANENPKNLSYLEALARISIAQGDIAGGIETLAKLCEQATSAEHAAGYLYRIADAHNQDNRPLPAIEKLKQALDLVPNHGASRVMLKKLLYAGKYFDNLVQLLQQEISVVDLEHKKDVLIELADLYENMLQNYEQSIDIWSKIWQESPDDISVLNKLLSIARKTNDSKKIVVYLQEIVNREERPDLLLELIRRYTELGNTAKQEATLIHASKVSAIRKDVLFQLSDLYKSQKDLEKYTQVMYQRIEMESSTTEKVAFLESVFLANEEGLRGGRELFAIASQILVLQPNHDRSLSVVSEYYYDIGEYAQALPYLITLSKDKKYAMSTSFEGRLAYSDFLYRYGHTLALLNRKEESLSILQQLLETIPYHMQGLRLIGPMLLNKKEWNQAAQVYKSLLMNIGSGGADSLDVYITLGEIDIARQHYDHAIQYFVRAYRIQPEDNRVRRSLALLCIIKGDWSKVVHLYQKIISSGTASREVTMEGMLIKSWILDKKLGHTDIAYKHLEQSLQFESNQPIVLLCMAEICYKLGNVKEGLALLEKMLEMEEGQYHTLALVLKSACLNHLGMSAEAQAILTLVEINPREVSGFIQEGFSSPLYEGAHIK